MALVPCKECNAEISEKAKVCPKCGQEDPIAKKIKCSECENMVVLSTEGACPICGNPEVLAEKPLTTVQIIPNDVLNDPEVHKKQSRVEDVFSKHMKNCPFCDGQIWITAKTCEHCNSDLDADYGKFLLGIPIIATALMWVWIWNGAYTKGDNTGTIILWTIVIFGTIWVISKELSHNEKIGRCISKYYDFGWILAGIFIVGIFTGHWVAKNISEILGILIIFSYYPFYLYKRAVFKLPNLSIIGIIIAFTFAYSVNNLEHKIKEYKNMVEQQKSLEKK